MDTLTNLSFKNLTKTEQVVMIINSGKELMTREEEGYIIHLYLLSGLFVELWYESRTYGTKTIVKVESFDKDSMIKNYPQINDMKHLFRN